MKKLLIITLVALIAAFWGSQTASAQCSHGQNDQSQSTPEKSSSATTQNASAAMCPMCQMMMADMDKMDMGKMMENMGCRMAMMSRMDDGMGMHFGMMGNADFSTWERKLDLTEPQKQELSDLQISAQKELVQKEADLKTLQLDLRQLLSPDRIDLTKVKSTLQKISTLQAEFGFSKISAYEEAKKILTPEQLSMLTRDVPEDKEMQTQDHQDHH